MRAVLVTTAMLAVGMGMAPASAAPPVPSADQLTAQLRQVLSTGTPDDQRAAALQGGQAAVPTANNIANALNRY